MLFKQSNWAALKRVLPVSIQNPLFHTTRMFQAERIAASGFRARAGSDQDDAYHDNAICFTRNFDYTKHLAFGEVTFILDANQLQHKYKMYPYDWPHINNQDKETYKRYDPDWFESETRVSVTPSDFRTRKDRQKDDDFCLLETTIPAKHIKASVIHLGKKQALSALIDKDERLRELIDTLAVLAPVVFLFDGKFYASKDILDVLEQELGVIKQKMPALFGPRMSQEEQQEEAGRLSSLFYKYRNNAAMKRRILQNQNTPLQVYRDALRDGDTVDDNDMGVTFGDEYQKSIIMDAMLRNKHLTEADRSEIYHQIDLTKIPEQGSSHELGFIHQIIQRTSDSTLLSLIYKDFKEMRQMFSVFRPLVENRNTSPAIVFDMIKGFLSSPDKEDADYALETIFNSYAFPETFFDRLVALPELHKYLVDYPILPEELKDQLEVNKVEP